MLHTRTVVGAHAEDLERLQCFASLDRDERAAIAEHLDEVEITAGTSLGPRGSAGQTLFVIREGVVELTEDQSPSRMLGPGECLGELSLDHSSFETATTVATTLVRGCSMSRARVEVLARRKTATVISGSVRTKPPSSQPATAAGAMLGSSRISST
jgi:CRP-like cAMP-binding protein